MFRLRAAVIAPGSELTYRESDWRDSLVVVERGEIELECLDGSRHRFRRGDSLWLAGLPLRAVRNPGRTPALLAGASREGEARRP